jgi:hypothetical protein
MAFASVVPFDEPFEERGSRVVGVNNPSLSDVNCHEYPLGLYPLFGRNGIADLYDLLGRRKRHSISHDDSSILWERLFCGYIHADPPDARLAPSWRETDPENSTLIRDGATKL